MTSCISEPVSHLRLERYLIDESTAAERADVQAHLSQCVVCRTCFDALRADGAAVAPLPNVSLPAPMPRRRVLHLALAAGGSVLAIAASLLLFLQSPREGVLPSRAAIAGTKGGGLSMSLVRQHAGSAAADPSIFVSGDRFEVQITCPPGALLRWDVVVLQGGEAFFPLRPDAAIECGNRVTLPGAFKLTGARPARVCVAVQAVGAVNRSALARKLPESSACVDLTPAP